jgi:predicted dienelactone hydrolase
MPTKRVIVALTLVLAIVAGCGDDDGDDTSSDPTAAETPGAGTATTGTDVEASDGDAPAPDEPGPFAVGRRTETVTDAGREDRTLTVEVWYPAAEEAEPTAYELIPGVEFASELSTLDAEPSTEGPFPVVVFSHGSGGLRQQTASIVETLASHGFVVVAPDHAGNTAIDQLAGTETDRATTAVNRVEDVGFLIDQMEAGALAAEVADLDRLAVMGHSFGGFTSLAVAGGFGDIPADDRVDAIVPLAPASSLLDDESLQSIRIPMLIVTGSADETTPVDPDSTRPLELAGGEARLVEIDGGSHSVVTNICDIIGAIEDATIELPAGAADAATELAGDTCEPTAEVSVDEAFDITEAHAVSFLRFHLYDDARYETVPELDKAAVRTP